MRKIILLCSVIASLFLVSSCSGTGDLFKYEVKIWYIEEYTDEETGEIKTRETSITTTQDDLEKTPRRYTRIKYEVLKLDETYEATTFDLSLIADSCDEFEIELKGFYLSYSKNSVVTDDSNKVDITMEKNVKIRSNKDFNLYFYGLDTNIIIENFIISDASPSDEGWLDDPDELPEE